MSRLSLLTKKALAEEASRNSSKVGSLGLRAPGQEGVWRTALCCFVAMDVPEAGKEESELRVM